MFTINKIITSINTPGVNKNSHFVLYLFVITILFQVTGLKFIWSIESISRIANLLTLIIIFGYTIKVIGTGCYLRKIWYYYLIPGIMIVGGMFLNISINALSNFKLVSFFGLTLPWFTYLAIPSLIKKEAINTETLWRYFYYFMLWANIMGLIEYILIFAGWGASMRVLNTPYGVFLGGRFSLLHMLEDGIAHYRYYACFMEPGTLAMFLLPAIAYAFFHRKYIALSIFVTGLIMSDSLGGFIGAAMLTPMLIYFRGKIRAIGLLLCFFSILLLVINFYDALYQRYENKQNSRIVREENLSNTIANLPEFLINYPLGMPLYESTGKAQQNKLYSGSNFALGNALHRGGVVSLLGYIAILAVSLWYALSRALRKDLSVDEQVTIVSILCLMPFIFQRTGLWDSSLFALLFAPSIIFYLQGGRQEKRSALI